MFEYKPGAGGNVASEYVAKAAPDGYTLLIGTAGTHGINAALYKKLAFDVEADFTPIAPLADVPNVLAVNPDVHRRQVGQGVHRRGEGGARQVQLRLDRQRRQHAPGLCPVQCRRRPRHGARALQGQPASPSRRMVTGEVCCSFAQVQTVLGQWRAGKVRLLGVSTKARVGILPDVPTVDEAALPGFENVTWYGLIAPKGLDAKIAERINAAVRKAQENPALREKLAGIGTAVAQRELEQFRATVKADRAKWAEIVKASGAKID